VRSRNKSLDIRSELFSLCLKGSGSYFELRKAYVTVDLVKSATFKAGGCYMFSNLRGCDGGRLYFNGGSSITLNGNILNRGKQFALEDVEVNVATFDLEDIRSVKRSFECTLVSNKRDKCGFISTEILAGITGIVSDRDHTRRLQRRVSHE